MGVLKAVANTNQSMVRVWGLRAGRSQAVGVCGRSVTDGPAHVSQFTIKIWQEPQVHLGPWGLL